MICDANNNANNNNDVGFVQRTLILGNCAGNSFCAESQLAQIGIKIFYRLETKVSPHRAGFCYMIREYLCCLLNSRPRPALL
jgi:hypothetical protein